MLLGGTEGTEGAEGAAGAEGAEGAEGASIKFLNDLLWLLSFSLCRLSFLQVLLYI
jgi:hypothetical protein